MLLMIFAITLTIGSAIFQIGAYRALPRRWHLWKWDIPIRDFIQKRPLVGLIVNYALSLLLVQFFGVGLAAGLANLMGSLAYALYMLLESRFQDRFPRFFNS